MAIVTTQEAQAKLPELMAGLQPGDEILIGDHGQPQAKLIRIEQTSWPCKAGSAKHLPHWMASDFDAPLDEFKEYME